LLERPIVRALTYSTPLSFSRRHTVRHIRSIGEPVARSMNQSGSELDEDKQAPSLDAERIVQRCGSMPGNRATALLTEARGCCANNGVMLIPAV